MSDRQVLLSKRLQMLADLVTPGNRLVDVGCDHGFLSIYLVQNKICPVALAMDVRKGPLAAAQEHIETAGLEDYISLRLSDGLLNFQDGEADTMVCAGMGGRLMAKILTDSMQKAQNLRELILQPQSELREFRSFLRENGFEIKQEDAVLEEGKYYFCMKAVFTGKNDTADGISNEYGELLLSQKHPVLYQYLSFRKKLLAELETALIAGNSVRAADRLAEIKTELAEVNTALAQFEENGVYGNS